MCNLKHKNLITCCNCCKSFCFWLARTSIELLYRISNGSCFVRFSISKLFICIVISLSFRPSSAICKSISSRLLYRRIERKNVSHCKFENKRRDLPASPSDEASIPIRFRSLPLAALASNFCLGLAFHSRVLESSWRSRATSSADKWFALPPARELSYTKPQLLWMWKKINLFAVSQNAQLQQRLDKLRRFALERFPRAMFAQKLFR